MRILYIRLWISLLLAFVFVNNNEGKSLDSLDGATTPKLLLCTDWTAGFSSNIYKDYNPDSRTWRGGLMAFPYFYLNKHIGVGIGGGFEYEHYQLKAFHLITTSRIGSIGFASNYKYGTNPIVQFQFVGRVYTSHLTKIVDDTKTKQTYKLSSLVYSLGWGPIITWKSLQFSPVIKLNYYDKPNIALNMSSLGDHSLGASCMLNLNFNLIRNK